MLRPVPPVLCDLSGLKVSSCHEATTGSIICIKVGDSDDVPDVDEKPHGVDKLLAADDETGALREGCAAACDSALLISNPFTSIPLMGLVMSVLGVLSGGRKAWGEVW